MEVQARNDPPRRGASGGFSCAPGDERECAGAAVTRGGASAARHFAPEAGGDAGYRDAFGAVLWDVGTVLAEPAGDA